jgi:hypothetical protein
MKTTIFKNRRHELRRLRRHNSGLDRKGTWVRKASVSFAERQARLLYDPQAVQDVDPAAGIPRRGPSSGG